MKRNILFGTTAIAIAAVAVALPAFAALNSGLKPGQSVSPFHPTHIAGPLAGTTNCFPCTFQNRPQVQVWFNNDSPANVKAIATQLDAAMTANKAKEFKALVVLVANKSTFKATEAQARTLVQSAGLKNVGVAVIDKSNEAIENYKINTNAQVKNTVFVYKNWMVTDKFVNLQANAQGNTSLNTAIAGVVR